MNKTLKPEMKRQLSPFPMKKRMRKTRVRGSLLDSCLAANTLTCFLHRDSAEHVNGDDRDSRPSATMQNPYPTALEEECSLCGAGGASAGYVCGKTLIRGSRDMSTYIMDTY